MSNHVKSSLSIYLSRKQCKMVFNFALRHDLPLYQITTYWPKHLDSHWPMGGVLIDWMFTVSEIYIMVADSQRSKLIIHIKYKAFRVESYNCYAFSVTRQIR